MHRSCCVLRGKIVLRVPHQQFAVHLGRYVNVNYQFEVDAINCFPFRQLKLLTSTEVKTLVSLYELVCHLVHLNDQFLSQFCDSVEILGATELLVGFISQGNEATF